MTRSAGSSRPARRVSADAGLRFITQRSGPVMDCNDDNDTVGGSVSWDWGATAVCVCVSTVANE